MVDLKLHGSVAEICDHLRINLEGLQNYVKLDDYAIDDECGGDIRVLQYKSARIGRLSVMTVTLDNLMGYLRCHGAACGPAAEEMEESLKEALHDRLF